MPASIDDTSSSLEKMMGRIREYIRVNGKQYWTLFDSGARNTYVIPRVASRLATTKLPKPLRSALGGKVRKTTTAALLVAQVEGHSSMEWP
jgi:hypothetical protein